MYANVLHICTFFELPKRNLECPILRVFIGKELSQKPEPYEKLENVYV